jgi:hypothetical protein
VLQSVFSGYSSCKSYNNTRSFTVSLAFGSPVQEPGATLPS